MFYTCSVHRVPKLPGAAASRRAYTLFVGLLFRSLHNRDTCRFNCKMGYDMMAVVGGAGIVVVTFFWFYLLITLALVSDK